MLIMLIFNLLYGRSVFVQYNTPTILMRVIQTVDANIAYFQATIGGERELYL